MVLLPIELIPSVVRRNRLLELNSRGPLVVVLFILIKGYNCCHGRNIKDPIPLVKFVNITSFTVHEMIADIKDSSVILVILLVQFSQCYFLYKFREYPQKLT